MFSGPAGLVSGSNGRRGPTRLDGADDPPATARDAARRVGVGASADDTAERPDIRSAAAAIAQPLALAPRPTGQAGPHLPPVRQCHAMGIQHFRGPELAQPRAAAQVRTTL